MKQERRQTPTSVYVADDHPVYRAGVVRLLTDAGHIVVGQGENGREALRDIKRLLPRVAILDVQMPDLNGVRVLEALRLGKVATRIILLSGFFDSEIVYEAVTCGVAALVTKTSGSEYIVKSVVSAARGETEISPELMGGLTNEVRKHESEIIRPLSEREAEVIHLMAEGKNRREMAQSLQISQATIKYHSGNLYTKLNVQSATAAVAEAMRRGLLE